jgi:uncharacterized protein YbbC (DUF1343 family)
MNNDSRAVFSRRARNILLGALVLLALSCPDSTGAEQSFATGADRLVAERCSLLTGKGVGLVTNHTGRLASGEYLVDALLRKKVQVRALFGPEHGIRGVTEGGEQIVDSVDAKTGIPVFSLYGRVNKPTPEMLKDIDLLVYDIQDVGARFYTYISTMKLCMEAAAERGIPFVVLDRPNPLGDLVDGPIVEDSLRSFVGIVPVPVVYGLTAGELATMINECGWLEGGKRAELIVVWMNGWIRAMRNTTPWIPPSPNIKHPATVDVYPSTCLIEATNVSEGRGTDAPFHIFGAPWVQKQELAARLNAARLPGVRFSPVSFTPVSSKHAGVECHGVALSIDSLALYRPLLTGVTILAVLRELYPDSLVIRPRSLGRLLGMGEGYMMLMSGVPASTIEARWQDALREYRSSLCRFRHYRLE